MASSDESSAVEDATSQNSQTKPEKKRKRKVRRRVRRSRQTDTSSQSPSQYKGSLRVSERTKSRRSAKTSEENSLTASRVERTNRVPASSSTTRDSETRSGSQRRDGSGQTKGNYLGIDTDTKSQAPSQNYSFVTAAPSIKEDSVTIKSSSKSDKRSDKGSSKKSSKKSERKDTWDPKTDFDKNVETYVDSKQTDFVSAAENPSDDSSSEKEDESKKDSEKKEKKKSSSGDSDSDSGKSKKKKSSSESKKSGSGSTVSSVGSGSGSSSGSGSGSGSNSGSSSGSSSSSSAKKSEKSGKSSKKSGKSSKKKGKSSKKSGKKTKKKKKKCSNCSRKCKHLIFLAFAIDIQLIILVFGCCAHGPELGTSPDTSESIGLWTNDSKRDADLSIGKALIVVANIVGFALLVALSICAIGTPKSKPSFFALIILSMLQYFTLLGAVWSLGASIRPEFQTVGWSYILTLVGWVMSHFCLACPFHPACINQKWDEDEDKKSENNKSVKGSTKKAKQKSSYKQID